MPNRRDFMTSMALASAIAAGGRARVAGQSGAGRRAASVGGRRVRVVDSHAHCAIPVGDIVRGTPFAGNGGAGGALALGPARLGVMDKQGVDVQALSINGFWWYAIADRDLADRVVRAQNEGLAAWCAAHAERFVAFASTSLQHPDLAARQLEDGVKRLGLRGAAIGGHVEGADLSAPRFDPFWAKAAELGVLVLMHPQGAGNIVRDGALDGRGDLGNIIGNPLETTYFLSRLMFDGVFDRFPSLKVCCAHGGGYLPSYVGRTDVACDVRPGAKCANAKRPREYLRHQILADTMVFSDEGLRHLVAEMGVGQVVYGTDVPYNWPVTIDLVLGASFLSDQDKDAILGGNLRTLLRLA
jgi:aminocarboxymuconate-semialdehyde decarboxylase